MSAARRGGAGRSSFTPLPNPPPQGGSERSAWVAPSQSHLEYLAVALLDLLALLLHGGGIIAHCLDFGERLASGFFCGLRMRRELAREIHEYLLRLAAMQPIVKQPRGVGIRCRFEYAARPLYD